MSAPWAPHGWCSCTDDDPDLCLICQAVRAEWSDSVARLMDMTVQDPERAARVRSFWERADTITWRSELGGYTMSIDSPDVAQAEVDQAIMDMLGAGIMRHLQEGQR